jgi:hypothetical protein
MNDPTENIRRDIVQGINSNPGERAPLETKYGQVWNTQELSNDFEVKGFMAPFISVTRKSDGAKGTLMFQDSPRYYFKFQEA